MAKGLIQVSPHHMRRLWELLILTENTFGTLTAQRR